jgi:membrane-associated HD superfamily phosphohydrolase
VFFHSQFLFPSLQSWKLKKKKCVDQYTLFSLTSTIKENNEKRRLNSIRSFVKLFTLGIIISFWRGRRWKIFLSKKFKLCTILRGFLRYFFLSSRCTIFSLSLLCRTGRIMFGNCSLKLNSSHSIKTITTWRQINLHFAEFFWFPPCVCLCVNLAPHSSYPVI